ncbi:copper resistance protein CopC [Shewanella sp. D64]|uniref:copper resistance CopC family protein n=1 Tax=unclassified Shewanella TaxID=196818 RepID=UPI0022BA4FAB|nr:MULTISPECIES: copper resistance CopC family protein [unclassified Shewanella]MEC4727708.1 copper resistance protein CopC [Shewanella sp. D64]MEC4739719.1 copper resistance protein CopC [Shewanella sp. E94]WBJ94102.1 copper resistance protein CopC [Shewanella sp. MTB7]
MKIIKILLVLVTFIFSSVAIAHTGLTASSPANKGVLQGSPKVLELSFNSSVRLVKLTLHDVKGKKINIGFKPRSVSSTQFAIALPELMSSNYSVNWMIMGEDVHKMKGTFSFMVRPTVPDTDDLKQNGLAND